MEHHRWSRHECTNSEEYRHDPDDPEVQIHADTHAAEVVDRRTPVVAQALIPNLLLRGIRENGPDSVKRETVGQR